MLVLSCEDLTESVKGGGALIISVEPNCGQGLAGGAVIDYPLRQLSARPPEELNELAIAAARVKRAGGRVLIVGLGEEDDRSCLLANALSIALEGRSAFPCPLSRAQELVLSWYARLREAVGVDQLHRLFEVGRTYEFGSGLEHASTVANVSLDLAQALAGAATARDLKSLYAAGLLHDIGRFVSERNHEEVGVRMLSVHKDALAGDFDVELVSFCIRHHRRHTNPASDPAAESLGKRALLLAAIVRLADAFTSVYEKEDYWGVHLSEGELTVVARYVNRDRFESKGRMLEEVAGVKVALSQPG